MRIETHRSEVLARCSKQMLPLERYSDYIFPNWKGCRYYNRPPQALDHSAMLLLYEDIVLLPSSWKWLSKFLLPDYTTQRWKEYQHSEAQSHPQPAPDHWLATTLCDVDAQWTSH